jgi:hypothetical protein
MHKILSDLLDQAYTWELFETEAFVCILDTLFSRTQVKNQITIHGMHACNAVFVAKGIQVIKIPRV